MPEIALRLPIAFIHERISDLALHPDAMCRAREILQAIKGLPI